MGRRLYLAILGVAAVLPWWSLLSLIGIGACAHAELGRWPRFGDPHPTGLGSHMLALSAVYCGLLSYLSPIVMLPWAVAIWIKAPAVRRDAWARCAALAYSAGAAAVYATWSLDPSGVVEWLLN